MASSRPGAAFCKSNCWFSFPLWTFPGLLVSSARLRTSTLAARFVRYRALKDVKPVTDVGQQDEDDSFCPSFQNVWVKKKRDHRMKTRGSWGNVASLDDFKSLLWKNAKMRKQTDKVGSNVSWWTWKWSDSFNVMEKLHHLWFYCNSLLSFKFNFGQHVTEQ